MREKATLTQTTLLLYHLAYNMSTLNRFNTAFKIFIATGSTVLLVKDKPLCYNTRIMNGYDFDETILKGNSVRRFFCYCFLRLPYLFIYLPVLFVAVIFKRCINSNTYYNMLTYFVKLIPNKQKFVTKYWDKHINKIKQWYYDQQKEDDIIISASPSYLVEEACRRIGVRCIATPVDLKTSKVIGGNHCYGAQKPKFFREQFGDAQLETFYSDSMSDEPMFKLARRGYLVKGDKITLIYENGEMLPKEKQIRIQ